MCWAGSVGVNDTRFLENTYLFTAVEGLLFYVTDTVTQQCQQMLPYISYGSIIFEDE